MDLQFGVFDHLDWGHRTIEQVFAHRLGLAERFDRAGFYAFHMAEHHGTTLSAAPSPNLFMAALTQRTKTLRMAPLVYILPLYNPLRLIEEICMIDHMSGGRLELGVGKGIAPFELLIGGINPLEAMDRYKEIYAILMEGLTQPKLNFRGHYYRYIDVPMVMRPLQQPHPPLWYGVWKDLNATIWPAQQGCNVAFIIEAKAVGPIVARFKEEWAKAQGAKPLPKIALNRTVIVAKTDQAARDIARRAHANFQASLSYLWHVFGAQPAHFPPDFEGVLAREMILCGSPATVRAELARQVEASGINYFVGRFAYGDMTDAEVDESVSYYLEDVVPHFRTAPVRAAAE